MTIDFDRFRAHLPDSPDEIVVALRGGFSLFTDVPFNESADAALATYERLLNAGPRDRFRWYYNEAMTEAKPVSPRSFSMMKRKLQLKKQEKHLYSLTFYNSAEPDIPAEHAVKLVWFPREGYSAYCASTLRYVIPGPELESRPHEMLEQVLATCEQLPFLSGLAGYSLEFGLYDEVEGLRASYGRMMRHPGIDLEYVISGCDSIGRGKGIKGLGWLTMLGTPLVDRLGGRETLRARLPDAVQIHPTAYGLVLQLGDAPVIGDVNRQDRLPLWRETYQVLKPVHEPVIEAWMTRGTKFDLGLDDEDEKTEAWLRRFE